MELKSTPDGLEYGGELVLKWNEQALPTMRGGVADALAVGVPVIVFETGELPRFQQMIWDEMG